MSRRIARRCAPKGAHARAASDHLPAEFPLYDVYPFDTRPIPADGVLSSAAAADAEKGRRVMKQIVPDIAAALMRAFA